MRVVAVVNQKGGVGKTTTAVTVGHALALESGPTLLVDLDPQGHLQHCLGRHDRNQSGMDRVLLDGDPIADKVREVRVDLGLVPAGPDLADFEAAQGGAERGYKLRHALASVADTYEFVVLDCGPASGMLAANAIAAASDVLVPVAGDYLSLTGLARLLLTLRRMQSMHLGEFDEWVFFNRFTPRRRLSREVYETVAEHFSDRLLGTSITEAAVLAECAGAGKSIFEYRKSSRAAREFRALSDDLLNKWMMGNEQEKASNVA